MLTSQLIQKINSNQISLVEKIDDFLKSKVLPLGLLFQMTGMLLVSSNDLYVMYTYIFCFIPGLLSLCAHLYCHGFLSSLRGITAGERLLLLLFVWIFIHSFIVGTDTNTDVVIIRLITLCLYLYVVRTVVLYSDNAEKMFLWACSIATFFALITMIYHYGVLDRSMGLRAFGIEGYRIGSLEIKEFAYLVSPILASLYYGVFAAVLSAFLIDHSNRSGLDVVCMFLAVSVIAVFILLSGSRGPLVALMCMLGMALMLFDNPRKSLFVFMLLGFFSLIVFLFHQRIIDEINNLFLGGFSGRFVIWEKTLEYISKSPLLGYGGFAEYQGPVIEGRIMKHPHSMILGIIFYWGMPAAVIYLVTVAWGVITAFLNREQQHMRIAGCILVFGFVGMLTDTYNLLTRPGLEWLLFFFPVALCVSKKRKFCIRNS